MIFEQEQIDLLKKELKGKNVVFTNGCFDILHRGHVDYLSNAKKLGDVLVVGLNTDQSVMRLKGKNRPINNQMDRAYMLDNLKSVDYVLYFKEDTPLEIISFLLPNILIKAKDYEDKEVVGQSIVENNGGFVKLLDFIPGYSSTKIINKIKEVD